MTTCQQGRNVASRPKVPVQLKALTYFSNEVVCPNTYLGQTPRGHSVEALDVLDGANSRSLYCGTTGVPRPSEQPVLLSSRTALMVQQILIFGLLMIEKSLREGEDRSR